MHAVERTSSGGIKRGVWWGEQDVDPEGLSPAQQAKGGGWMDTILNLIPGRRAAASNEPSEEAIRRTHDSLRWARDRPPCGRAQPACVSPDWQGSRRVPHCARWTSLRSVGQTRLAGSADSYLRQCSRMGLLLHLPLSAVVA